MVPDAGYAFHKCEVSVWSILFGAKRHDNMCRRVSALFFFLPRNPKLTCSHVRVRGIGC